MIDVEKSTESDNTPVPVAEVEPKGSDLRQSIIDAVVSIDAKEAPKARPEVQEAPEPVVVRDTQPPLDPPAEWRGDEKEDFKAMSRKQQEATLRLHKSRNSMLEQIKQEKGQLEYIKELAEQVEHYAKIRGDKGFQPDDISKSIKLFREIHDNPKKAIKDILGARGLSIKDLEEQAAAVAENNSVPPALQEKLSSLESFVAEEKKAKAQQSFAQKSALISEQWKIFESAKNAAGKPRFPDALKDGEEGLRFGRSIGSLVDGESELSKEFIADAQARIPGLTYLGLIEEAYKLRGGKVDDSEAPRTQDTQKHVLKSSRAASSVPGLGGQSSSAGVTKKLSLREAQAKALREIREREGH